MEVLSMLINEVGGFPYDELEGFRNPDGYLVNRWFTAKEMKEHRAKWLDHRKTAYSDLEAYVAAHKELFDQTLPLLAVSGNIINDEFSVMLVVQRKYVNNNK